VQEAWKAANQDDPSRPLMRMGRFVDPALEARFRDATASEDIALISKGMLFCAAYAFVFLPTDYSLFGWTYAFGGLVAVRVALALACLGVLALAHHPVGRNHRDKALLLFCFIGIAVIATINLSRPPDYVLGIAVDVCVALVYFLLLPNRFLYQVSAAVLYSVATVTVFVASKDGVNTAGYAAVIVAFAVATGAGALAGKHQQERRRARFYYQERLEEALSKIRTLQGLIPICCKCKKIRDDDGFWQSFERYVMEHSDAEFSHGMCPECMHVELKEAGIDPEQYEGLGSSDLQGADRD